jgi:hypothetical protein
LLKLARKLLSHYDKFGVAAALGWSALCTGAIAIPTLIIEQLISVFTSIGRKDFLTMLLVSPIVIYIVPTFWVAGTLIVERLWMFVGIHWLFGWEPYRFRKMIGRLVGEHKH